MLKEVIAITLKFGMLLNQQHDIKAFDLAALLKLFDLKSTLKKEKSAYQIVMKQYL